MFEHMKNYRNLLQKVSTWLVPETGRLFVHIFAHKEFAYDYDTGDDDSWMAKYFFTGGTMPSADLFLWFPEHLEVVDRWLVDGTHYRE
jgi:cyclopropane fatty-acyl-phospholipid synthase-like methyltransferase